MMKKWPKRPISSRFVLHNCENCEIQFAHTQWREQGWFARSEKEGVSE